MSESPPAVFIEALQSLKGTRARPEIQLTEIPPPTRIAPWALALNAQINPSGDPDDMLGHGRFITLHDPAGQDAWHGTFRIIVMASATIDPEMGMDPLLAEAGWTWLLDALDDNGAGFHHVSGTVTRTMSESFGDLSITDSDIEMEIRASWTPNTADLSPHLDAWLSLLASLAGLQPNEPGVTALTRSLSHGTSSTPLPL